VEINRPKLHFTPVKNWMNDPNGLVYYQGEYHLFYQHNPFDNVWGPMHWGHAVSKDLLNWEHLDIALKPDELGTIFSGSAVVDEKNSSRLFEDENGGLVAFYTNHYEEGGQVRETQSMAYSKDRGRTWIKYDKNPIIENPGIKDFRDPKVFYHKDTGKWIMILSAGNKAMIYISENLKDWQYVSEFGENLGAKTGIWECPDLFELEVANTGEKLWVLKFDLVRHKENTQSQTKYFVGDFDGKNFSMLNPESTWIDFGRDFYAAQSWSNLPNSRSIWLGWMSNWDYANKIPANDWRSAMTIPREIGLVRAEERYFLAQKPVREIKNSREKIHGEEEFLIRSKEYPIEASAEISLEIEKYKDFEIRFENSLGEYVDLTYNSEGSKVIFKREKSGVTEFSESFEKEMEIGPLIGMEGDELKVNILLDQNSIEVFFNDGIDVITNLIFPKEEINKMSLTSAKDQVRVKKLDIWSL